MHRNDIQKGFLRIAGISLMLFAVFSAASVSGQTEEQGQDKPRDIFHLTLPAEWGRVREIYKGEPGRVVVHIQEAHTHYECQQNIMSILDHLVEQYGLSIVGIEGVPGRVETEIFASYPDDGARYEATDYFIRIGKMSGPEALVISRGIEYPLQLYGIEDPKLYLDNFRMFHGAYPFRSEALLSFISLAYYLGELKTVIYADNPDLVLFDVRQLEFKSDTIPLNEYCLELLSQMQRFKLPLDPYEHFARYVHAVTLEDRIDFGAAEQERTALLSELTDTLDDEEMQLLMDMGEAFRKQELSAAGYLQFLRDLATGKNMNMSGYQNLDMYITYARTFDELNTTGLFHEIEDIGFAIKEKLHVTPEQRHLDFLSHGLEVLKRMVEIKMVNRDLEFYRQNADRLVSAAFYDFITIQAAQYGIPVSLDRSEAGFIDVYAPAWVEFYRKAGLRDEAMVNNSMKLFDAHNQGIIAMVTGGFHTAELTRLMREKNISHLVITPRVTDASPTPYFDRMTGKKTELEMILKDAGSISPGRGTTP